MSNKWMYFLLSAMWFVVGVFHACTHKTPWAVIVSAVGGVIFLALALFQGRMERKGAAGRRGMKIIDNIALITVIAAVTVIVILGLL